MWIKHIEALLLLFTISKKIDIDPFINDKKNFSFICFNEFEDFDTLVESISTGNITFYDSEVDSVTEDDLNFIRKILRKLKIDFSENYDGYNFLSILINRKN